MFTRRRKLLSQNFLRQKSLAQKLVNSSSITKNDHVVEIGPGKGTITRQLVTKAKTVTAVEIDYYWYDYLRSRFKNTSNITFYHNDFLKFNLPNTPYKVFANIPFSIEGKAVRKLVNDQNPPDDCYLIVRKEFGYRLTGKYRDNMFTSMHTPWFSFSIPYYFQCTDFVPAPKVNSIMIKITKRQKPFLEWHQRARYQAFVKHSFRNGVPIVKNLNRNFDKKDVKKAIGNIKAYKKTKPSHLQVFQWILLFRELCCSGTTD